MTFGRLPMVGKVTAFVGGLSIAAAGVVGIRPVFSSVSTNQALVASAGASSAARSGECVSPTAGAGWRLPRVRLIPTRLGCVPDLRPKPWQMKAILGAQVRALKPWQAKALLAAPASAVRLRPAPSRDRGPESSTEARRVGTVTLPYGW
jgi:hypothetical protein